MRRWLPYLLLCCLTACGREGVSLALTPTAVPLPTLAATLPLPTATLAATSTAEPVATAIEVPTSAPLPTATSTAEPTATPDPFAGLSIASLRQERYGEEGEIEIVETLERTDTFTRYRIAFPSDGLRVDGFMNVPVGEGPFPVVIVNHGYMPPQSYELLTYTTKYADALARAGFLAIHPGFRNHRGSEEGENPFRIGFARDVLNLIPMAQRLPQANGGRVGLWGHSMGGGVTLRVLTISDQVAAAVLYGSMSGDEAKNYEAIVRWSGGSALHNGSLPAPPSEETLYAAVSPLNFVEKIGAPLAIHHGVRDSTVPFSWSEELAARIDAEGISYEFYAYPDQDHNFAGAGYDLFQERMIAFFRQHLAPPR